MYTTAFTVDRIVEIQSTGKRNTFTGTLYFLKIVPWHDA